MYHFEKKTSKNLEIFERKKWVFLKKSLRSPMPLIQRIFYFFWNFFFKYIRGQSTSNATWIFRIQRNIET